MARLCFVTIERFEEIIKDFASPDVHSRTKAEEGRRLKVIDGGWVIVNYLQNRELTQRKTGSHADRQARYREKLAKRDSMASPSRVLDDSPEEQRCASVTSDADASQVTRGRGRREAEAEERQTKEKEEKKIVGAAAPPAVLNTVLSFKTDGGEDHWDLDQSQVDAWVDLYPGINVLAECRKSFAWIEANPTRRKTAKGMPRFIVNWLGRATNTPRSGSRGGQAVAPPVAPYSPADEFDELDIPL